MSRRLQARGAWGGPGAAGRSGGGGRGKGVNHLPDRWKDYLPVGQRMPGTRFIAFKVPLKKSFEGKLAPEERFSPLDLVNKIREQNEELGLVIDLTYTQRYYKPEELPEALPYLKIFTVGHQVPDDNTIFKFKCAVNKFLKENQDNDKLIGVHCTHGLNRTGYLVCRYLIDVQGMKPNDAIELFNRCRGHAIERQNYIDDLQHGPIRKNDGTLRSDHFEESSFIKRRNFYNTHETDYHRRRRTFHWSRDFHSQPQEDFHYQSHEFHSQPRDFRSHRREFHSQPRDFYQSSRKNQHRRNYTCQNVGSHPPLPPPGPPREDYSQSRYTWNLKPNYNLPPWNKRQKLNSYNGPYFPDQWGPDGQPQTYRSQMGENNWHDV
ncbi:RNA/RNP complex-1-interacting phosphatase isoform X1 [Petaurus breviceps papuanus]|uniref:RNA/RNP complex-1-interacting phosphatase isoform X1 n=1 Tax=Petaurus breviceps papuanus TaxID=3040969 RepID=UPI0036DE1EDD